MNLIRELLDALGELLRDFSQPRILLQQFKYLSCLPGCQERAGLVAAGQTSGAKMHRTRYTAGQRVLDDDMPAVDDHDLLA